MEKLHYLGLLFLNFVILNVLLSFIFFLLSIAVKSTLSSPLLKSRLFFVSLVAPPALSALTIFTSFMPPLFVKIPGRTMFCFNEPYCYIFSFISPEIPLFHGLLLAAVGLVLGPILYSIINIRAYLRMHAVMDELSTSGLKSLTMTIDKTGISKKVLEELRKFEDLYKIRVKVIDTPGKISLLWGYVFNILILSTGVLNTLSLNELRGLLAHELSHYRRRDNILKGVLLLCRNSLFPFPHVYYLFRWWREEIELIGDEQAAVTTGRPLDVASALIKIMNPSPPEEIPFLMEGMEKLETYAIGFSVIRGKHIFTNRVERLVAIHDCRIRAGYERHSILPSETGLLISMASLFPLFFIAIYEFNPLLVHCYLERLLSLI